VASAIAVILVALVLGMARLQAFLVSERDEARA